MSFTWSGEAGKSQDIRLVLITENGADQGVKKLHLIKNFLFVLGSLFGNQNDISICRFDFIAGLLSSRGLNSRGLSGARFEISAWLVAPFQRKAGSNRFSELSGSNFDYFFKNTDPI